MIPFCSYKRMKEKTNRNYRGRGENAQKAVLLAGSNNKRYGSYASELNADNPFTLPGYLVT